MTAGDPRSPAPCPFPVFASVRGSTRIYWCICVVFNATDRAEGGTQGCPWAW